MMAKCGDCGHLASWNSYFGAYYCSVCGNYFELSPEPKYDICRDNVTCCDDNCQACANRIYQRYMKLKEAAKDAPV